MTVEAITTAPVRRSGAPREVLNLTVASAPSGQLALPGPAGFTGGRHGGYDAKTCTERIAKENMPAIYDPALKLGISAFLQHLFDSGNAFETKIGEILSRFAVHRSNIVVIEEVRDELGERTVEGKQAKEAATLKAMLDPNVTVIFNARISVHFEHLLCLERGEEPRDLDPMRVSEPDMLVRASFGDGMQWYPVDIKDHKTCSGKSQPRTYQASTLADADLVHDEIDLGGQMHKEDLIQLSHYWRHLQACGLAPADGEIQPWGAVVGREEVLVWVRLDEPRFLVSAPGTTTRVKTSPLRIYDRNFERADRVTVNARARNVDPDMPAMTEPEWKADCKECDWKAVCLEELTGYGDGGHITLLPGITPERAKAHYAAGVRSIGQLARLDIETARAIDAGAEPTTVDGYCTTTARYVGTGVHRLVEAIYQARVTRTGEVHRAPDVDFVEVPRAAIEIDFDLENGVNPLRADYGPVERSDGPLLYMFGALATGRRRRPDRTMRTRQEMHTFDDYTDTDAGECKVFAETWDYFQFMIGKAKHNKHSIRFYHWTRHERTWMKALATKYAGRPGVPTLEQVEAFLDSGLVIDMYEILSRQLVWPTKSHSIKDIAKFLKFEWPMADAGGDSSLVWYRDAVLGSPAVQDEFRLLLRDYNQADVEAQRHIRDWLTMLGAARKPGEKLPSVTTLRKPLPKRS